MSDSVIWKYELRPAVTQKIRLHEGDVPLSVGVQGDGIVMWVKVKPAESPETREFHVFPTGYLFEEDAAGFNHVGTVQMKDGLVFHVFC